MRSLISFAAALFVGVAAQAATITDDAAYVGLFGGDIYSKSTAPVSADMAVSAVFLTGGLGFTPLVALELMTGNDRFLLAETSDWSLSDENVLSFRFDLEHSNALGDWLTVEYALGAAVADPFNPAVPDADVMARMTITTGVDVPAVPVPVPATLPLLLGALGVGAAALRRKG